MKRWSNHLKQTGQNRLNFCSILAFAAGKVNWGWSTQNSLSNSDWFQNITEEDELKCMKRNRILGVNHGKTWSGMSQCFLYNFRSQHHGTRTVLQSHVELCDQEVNVVLLFGFKGLRYETCSFPMFLSSERHSVHLQDYLTHLQLSTVMSRTTSLWERE